MTSFVPDGEEYWIAISRSSMDFCLVKVVESVVPAKKKGMMK